MSPELLTLLTGLATLATTLIGLTVAVVALYIKLKQVHHMVNSELSEIKLLIASQAFAEGLAEGKAQKGSEPS